MGLNYDLGDKSENLRRMNHLKKLNKAKKKFFAENARFFMYYVCILALKIEDKKWKDLSQARIAGLA